MSGNNKFKIIVQYYAILREQVGKSEETVETNARTPSELYEQIITHNRLQLSQKLFKVAINDEFCHWDTKLKQGDKIIFIPPVAGG